MEKICKNCGPQPASGWREVMKSGRKILRCIKCTRESNKRSYWKDPEKRRKHANDWREANPEKKASQNAEWRAENGERRRQYMRDRARRIKERVILHYGDACACCHESNIAFLCLDHVNGGGNKHRAEVGGGSSFYGWIVRNGFPDGFQILCHNCNFAKGAYGECPHVRT